MSNEAFDDLEGLGYGALGGSGTDALDQVHTAVTQNGVESKCNCGRCNLPNVITCEWNEAIIGSFGFVPPNWRVDPPTGTLFPYVGCASCRFEIKVGYTPGELKSYVGKAAEKNFLTPDNLNMISQLQARAAQAANGRR